MHKRYAFLTLFFVFSIMGSACTSPVGSVSVASQTLSSNSGNSGTGQSNENYSQQITWSFPTPKPAKKTP